MAAQTSPIARARLLQSIRLCLLQSVRSCRRRIFGTRLPQIPRSLLLMAVTLPWSAGAALAADATVLVASGDVNLVRTAADGSRTAVRLRTRDELSQGDLVQTMTDGRAQLRFTDGAIISLQPSTEFRIDEYRYDGPQQRGFFTLLRGALRTATGAIGKRDRDDYRMQTPTATIGIRGTDYVAEQTVCDPRCSPGPTAGLRVAVNEGRVALTSRGGSIELGRGQTAQVGSPDAAPSLTRARPVLNPPTNIRPRSEAPGADSSLAQAGETTALAAWSAAFGGVTSAAGSTTIGSTTIGGTGAVSPRRGGRSTRDDATADGATSNDPISKEITLAATGGGLAIAGDQPAVMSPNSSRSPSGELVAVVVPNAGGGGATGGAGAGAGNATGSVGNGGAAGDGGVGGSGGTGAGDNGGSGDIGGSDGSGGSGSGGSTGGTGNTGDTGNSGNSGGTAPNDPLASALRTGGVVYVGIRGNAVLNAASLLGLAARVEVDPAFRMTSVGACPSLLCLSNGTTRLADAGSDPYVSWGRWTDGSARLTTAGVPIAVGFSANQGVHYLLGVPSVSLPTSGMFSFDLTAATRPTISDGSAAPGSLQASAVAQFGPGSAARVGLSGQVTMANSAYSFTTPGGLASPSASTLTMTGSTTFGGSVSALRSGAEQLNCQGNGCRMDVRGGFFGPQGARIGIDYSIVEPGTARTIDGVGVFTRR